MDDVEESMLDSEVGLERKPRKSTMEKTDGEVRYSSIEAGERSLMEINVKKLSVYFDEIEGSEDAVGGTDVFMDEKMREKAEDDTVLSSLKVENKSSLFISLSSEGYEKTETAMLHPIPDIIEAHEQNGVVHESKEDLGKTDVERVLEEQETHDLYCPNCRSCITKRVILRKRKRTVFDSPYVEKPEIEEEPYFLDVAHTTDLPDRKEPKVFRCLQCFEFFVVTGSSLNCISLFTGWWKGKTPGTGYQTIAPVALKPGSPSISHEPGLPIASSTEPMKPAPSSPLGPLAGYQTIAPVALKPGSPSISHEPGLPIASSTEPMKPAPSSPLGPSAGYQTIAPVALKPGSPSISHEPGLPIASSTEPMKPAPSSPLGPLAEIPTTAPTVSLYVPQVIGGAEIVVEPATRSWDVLKSIVYGGLVESIASLGVVSSAAGGDADTLNIIALGLANLIGGLFMIAHNLWELRIERQDRGRTTNQEDKINRYEQTLGNVNNFRLHATVVVLVYIVSGVIPPITYGFSFRKSDNKDYKLIAVAVASLFCTALLAVGKAHIQKVSRSHYLKVVLYYVTLGLLASGLSYATGNLVKKLLVKLGFVSSAATPTSDFGFLGSGLMTSEWASY